MATNYEALAKEFGGTVQPANDAGGMGTDAAGRPVLRVNIPRPKPAEEVDYSALASQFGGAVQPVQTVDVPPSEFAEDETTAGGVFGATTRGLAPALAGAGLGGMVAGPPGALAGAATATLAPLIFDPIVTGVNRLLGTEFSTPTEAMENLFASIGVPEAKTAAERIIQSTATAAGGAAGGMGLGRMLAQGAAAVPTVTQGVGAALAAQPTAQLVGAGAAGAAGQMVAEVGGDPAAQIVASVLAGIVTPVAGEAALQALGTSFRRLGRGYVEEAAARLLQESTLNNPADVAQRIEVALTGPNPAGVMPTTAEVAGDIGLSGLTRSLQSGVQSGAQISDRLASNAQQRQLAANRALGAGDVTQLPALAAQTAASNARMIGAQRAAVGALEPPEVAGTQARAVLGEAERAAKARASALYDIPGGEEIVQVGPVEFDLPAVSMPSQNDVGRFAQGVRETLADRVPDADAAAMRAQGGSLLGLLRSEGVNPQSPLGRDLIRMGYGPQQLPGLFRNNASPRAELDKTIQTARERGLIPAAPANAPDTFGANDFLDTLLADLGAAGRGGTGRRAMNVDAQVARAETQARQQNQDYVRQMLDERGLDIERMNADDWDALYRDVNSLPPRPVTQNDVEYLQQRADDADRVRVLSPFQSSLLDIMRDYFPAGLPPQSGVASLIGQLVKADVLETRQVERIISDLRRQSGRLKGSDNISAGLAKSAANAAEGFLSAQAGPARMKAMRRARQGYREYATTFRNNEVGRALATDNFGNPRLDEARVPGTLVPAGATGAGAAQRLQGAIGADEAEGIARGQLRRELEAAGNNPQRIEGVLTKYQDTLRAYPAARSDVDAVRQVAALNEQFMSSPLRQVAEAGDAVQAVSTLLRKKDGARDFRRLVGQVRPNREAAAGLRRAIGNYIEEASAGGFDANGVQLVRNAELEKALVNVLSKTEGTNLLSREQRSALLNLRMQAKRVQAAATNNRAPGSDSVRNAETWGRLASVVLQGIGASKLGAMNTVLDATAAVLGRASAVRDLTVQAMLDPALAADLLRKPTPRRLDAVGARMRAYAIGAQPAIVQTDREQPQ
jgi:hypothetical protein